MDFSYSKLKSSIILRGYELKACIILYYGSRSKYIWVQGQITRITSVWKSHVTSSLFFLPKFSRPQTIQCQLRNVLGKNTQIPLGHLWDREESFYSPTGQTDDSLPTIRTSFRFIIYPYQKRWQQVQECFQIVLERLAHQDRSFFGREAMLVPFITALC